LFLFTINVNSLRYFTSFKVLSLNKTYSLLIIYLYETDLRISFVLKIKDKFFIIAKTLTLWWINFIIIW
jgi:hypothetical protein